MSYAEQKWTVDQVNEKIQSSDSGKDLYIAGIPRGTPEVKSLSGNVHLVAATSQSSSKRIATVNGSGWIVGLSAYVTNPQYATQTVVATLTIPDGDENVVLKTSGSFEYGVDKYTNGALTINTELIAGSRIKGTLPTNPTINAPVRFENGFILDISISTPGHSGSGYGNTSVQYILDETPPRLSKQVIPFLLHREGAAA